MKIEPLPKRVLVSNFKKGERIVRGIILLDDDKKTQGIRPRWAQVYAVGDEVTEVAKGQWILISHGRWSREMKIQVDDATISLWSVELDAIIAVTDNEPQDEGFGTNES